MLLPSPAYTPAQWTTFFSAEAGASAGLTGLLFVAISINLRQIVGNRILTSRAAKALATLAAVLLIATVCLVPGQTGASLGWEMLPLAVVGWVAIHSTQRRATRDNPYVSAAQRRFSNTVAQLSIVPMIVCGVSLVVGRGGGLYWAVMGVLFSLVAALLDSWVLLIEIQR